MKTLKDRDINDDNSHTTKPGSLEDLFSGYIHMLMSRSSISWCKTGFSEEKGHRQGGGRKGCWWGSAITKGWRILGNGKEAKRSLSLLGKGRMTWPPKVKWAARCLRVLVTPSFYHSDIFHSQLISLQLPLLSFHTECNLTLGPGSTSFLSGGHLDSTQQSCCMRIPEKWPMWMDHCTQCLYGRELTWIYSGSVLLNESGKEKRNGKQKPLCKC